MANKMRADLQAFRGIAIFAVLLFHFFPKEFPNGYIGVDQFFVLSGYLIAMVLYSKNLNRGAIIDFYNRRVKRIVPLYFSVIILILIAAYTLLPQFVEQNVDSAIYAMRFTTNIANMSPNKAYAVQVRKISRRVSVVSVVSYLTLGIMVVQMFWPAAIPADILRCNMTFFTGLLIVLGRDAPIWPMTRWFITYLGNISYALYLIHWPIYTYTKTIYKDDAYVLSFAMIISIIFAIVITETYEKWYLRLDSSSIYRLIGLLYGCCLLFLVPQMLNAMNDDTSAIMVDFRNLTKSQVIRLNKRWTDEDYQIKRNLSCQIRDDICEYKPNTVGSAEPSILTIGNSYAANAAELVFDNCRNITSRHSLYWTTGCEPLIAERPPYVHKKHCSPDVIDTFLTFVQRVKPDILFIHVRHIQLCRPQTNNGSILNDTLYMEARSRLRSYELFVSKRIYIIGVLPTPVNGITAIINNAIKTGKDLKMADLINPDMHTEVARLRIDAFIKDSKMCKLVDWAPDLIVDGEFQLYEKDRGLAYFTDTLHPTPLALKKIKKTLERVCYV